MSVGLNQGEKMLVELHFMLYSNKKKTYPNIMLISHQMMIVGYYKCSQERPRDNKS